MQTPLLREDIVNGIIWMIFNAHLLVNYPPKVRLSQMVNPLKGISSRKLKRHHPGLIKPAHLKNTLWGLHASPDNR